MTAPRHTRSHWEPISAAPAARKQKMICLIDREFIVDVPLDRAWDHLARIEAWPSWAQHIKRIELRPAGGLGPQSTGVIHLGVGLTATFQVTEFNPPQNWAWVAPFLWLKVIYDHRFEALDADRTKLVFLVQAIGFGARVLGPVFAWIYRRDLERAIPALIREMNATRPPTLSPQ